MTRAPSRVDPGSSSRDQGSSDVNGGGSWRRQVRFADNGEGSSRGEGSWRRQDSFTGNGEGSTGRQGSSIGNGEGSSPRVGSATANVEGATQLDGFAACEVCKKGGFCGGWHRTMVSALYWHPERAKPWL